MTIPKTIVVYEHHGYAVYADGVHVASYGCDSWNVSGWFNLCKLLGIELVQRKLSDYRDFPGWLDGACHPPKLLADVERHLAELDERRRVARVAALEAELARLKGGGSQ